MPVRRAEPHHPEAHYYRGLLLEERGDRHGACDAFLRTRQLELELTLGRLGRVQTMPDLFAGSLASATRLLEEHFDTEQAPVEGALALLEDMIALDIAPSYPDISGSLAQLRNLPDRDG